MLTEKEQKGLEEILQELNEKDLLDLCNLTTKSMAKAQTVKDAMQTILKLTEKPILLLRRKKISKSLIFTYLMKMNIIVSVDGSKSDYIEACLDLWQSDKSYKNSMDCLDGNEDFVGTTVSNQLLQVTSIQNLEEEFLTLRFLHFLRPFFQDLNSHMNFRATYFLPDCILWLITTYNATEKIDGKSGAMNVAENLLRFVNTYDCTFEPDYNSLFGQKEQEDSLVVCLSGKVYCQHVSLAFSSRFSFVVEPTFNMLIKQIDLQITKNV